MRPSEHETTVDDSYSVTVPPSVREAVGIDAGDTIRWVVDDAGVVGVEVVGEREKGLADLEPVDVGEATHAAADHDLVAGDR